MGKLFALLESNVFMSLKGNIWQLLIINYWPILQVQFYSFLVHLLSFLMWKFPTQTYQLFLV